MVLKRVVYMLGFLILSAAAGAQINIYLGGNLQGNLSWIRGDEPSFKPGFGGGFSFVYWEYEYWFIKAGLNYNYKSSSSLEYPDNYDVEITGPDDRINLEVFEQTIGVPLTLYFRPFESGENTLLITGSLATQMVVHLKENSEEFGELVLKGNEIKTRMKTGVGIGVGYQRELDRQLFLNVYPSFNVDIRSRHPFNSITLTAEILFGVY
jgi:hypothetical protein